MSRAYKNYWSQHEANITYPESCEQSPCSSFRFGFENLPQCPGLSIIFFFFLDFEEKSQRRSDLFPYLFPSIICGVLLSLFLWRILLKTFPQVGKETVLNSISAIRLPLSLPWLSLSASNQLWGSPDKALKSLSPLATSTYVSAAHTPLARTANV